MGSALIRGLAIFCFGALAVGAFSEPLAAEKLDGPDGSHQPGHGLSTQSVAVQARRIASEGVKLRVLCAGDSITVGFLSDHDGGDGNGYRLQLRDRLEESGDEVVFAGTDKYSGSTMTDAYFAAWSGMTIKFIDDHISPSLLQRPNVILLHAGTNDMNPNHAVSREGNDPEAAAVRLGDLLDHIIDACPDAVVLVAMIIGTCNFDQSPQTEEFQSLIPDIVKDRRDAGHHVLAVDFSGFPMSDLRDCIHPTNDGYRKLGDYWYDAMTQIPREWISMPVGPDPVRPPEAESSSTRYGSFAFSTIVRAFSVICATHVIQAVYAWE
ncbi:Multidomain esterase [Paramyrothecium foliicola]|nr:Multidomain esterase [Paramyrothecium foliicola]